MKLITQSQMTALLRNGAPAHRDQDHPPVVKLFTPDAIATWLLSEIDPEQPDLAFGLCDLGMGFPELGYVSLSALQELHGPLGLPVERDRHFVGRHPMSIYLEAARRQWSIVTDEKILAECAGY
jgi:hypothetical protein